MLIVALFFGVTFTFKNSQIVNLTYYFDINWDGPLSWLLILTFICGALFGALALLCTALRRKMFGSSSQQKNK